MEQSAPELIAFGGKVLLGAVVIPIWIAMGLADYFCHRATNIEGTAGAPESIMHLVQFALVGIPLTAALFLNVNAGILALMLAFIVLHHIAAYIDLHCAASKRVILPIEQMVHSFLELLPITAFLLVGALEFAQLQALFGCGTEHPDFMLEVRNPPLSVWYVAAVVVAATLANLLPYLEELLRCLRARRQIADTTTTL